MKDLYAAARHLYLEAFPDESPAFLDALFAIGFPRHLMAIGDGGKLVSMLFSLPYSILTQDGPKEARYLYAVATAREYRGKGYARRLLAEAASDGLPVFLRPMSPSLFDFYKSAGFTPFSPYTEISGEVCEPCGMTSTAIRSLSPADYLAARDKLLTPPYCRMTESFLSLSFGYGGAVGLDGRFAALYERHGDTVFFKEWLGDRTLLPHVAAELGAKHFKARFPDRNGSPFGVGIGVHPDTVFLAALD